MSTANGWLRHTPNFISLSRMVMALGFPFAGTKLRLVLLVAGLGADFLDGFLARRFCWQSRLGRLLDPIADKVFVLAITLTFFLESQAGLLTCFFFALRDLTVIAGAIYLVRHKRLNHFHNMRPTRLGKTTTVFQIIALFSCAWFGDFDLITLYSTCILSGLSAIQYRLAFAATAAFTTAPPRQRDQR